MTSSDEPAVGLCPECAFGQSVTSDRGFQFWRCRLSDADQRFPKYPRLPVLACEGYAAPPTDRKDGI